MKKEQKYFYIIQYLDRERNKYKIGCNKNPEKLLVRYQKDNIFELRLIMSELWDNSHDVRVGIYNLYKSKYIHYDWYEIDDINKLYKDIINIRVKLEEGEKLRSEYKNELKKLRDNLNKK